MGPACELRASKSSGFGMKTENHQMFLICAMGLLLVALSGCNAEPAPSSPLKVRWTTVAMNVDTTISSKTKRQDYITLKLSGISNTGPKSLPLVAAVSDSELEFRTLENLLLHHWKYTGYTPIMIVADKSMFDHHVSYIQSGPHGIRQTGNLKPVYVPIHGTSHKLWWMLVPISYNPAGATISISFIQKYSAPNGYFTAFRIWPDSNLQHVSGCARAADGIPYTEDSGKGMVVTPYDDAGPGFHGWCYKNLGLSGPQSIATDYFSVSTASSWLQIAGWTNKQFTRVEGVTSHALPRIVKKLHLKSTGITGKQKIVSIRTWMKNNLRYSVFDSKEAGIPNSFDTIIRNHGGDCTDLVLVMVTLLHAAGIEADEAVTSTTLRYPFRVNSANLSALNHVVAYLPKYHHFIDATAKAEGDQSYLAIQDVMDVVTGKILEPTKDQIQFFR
jgi:hypothetical protein